MVRDQGDSCKKQRSWKPKTWIARELDISQKDMRERKQGKKVYLLWGTKCMIHARGGALI